MSKSFEAEALSVQMTVSPAAVVTDPESYNEGYEAGKLAGGSVTPEQIQEAVDNYLEEHPVEFTETDPTVPDWARQPNKPTYTADDIGTYPKEEIDEKIQNHHLVVAIEVDENSCTVRSGTFEQIERAYRNGSVVSLEVYKKGGSIEFNTAEVAEINVDYIEFIGVWANTFSMYTWRMDNTVTALTASVYSKDEVNTMHSGLLRISQHMADVNIINERIDAVINDTYTKANTYTKDETNSAISNYVGHNELLTRLNVENVTNGVLYVNNRIDVALADIASALDELHNYAQALIGGASE